MKKLCIFIINLRSEWFLKQAFRKSLGGVAPPTMSRWSGGYEEFVADVGTATVTMVLEFTSGKDFMLSEEYSMPAHPATYVNPDGSIDMIPGRGFRSEYKGTYRDRGRVLVLSMEDGTEMELRREGDGLVGETPFGEEVVFRKGE